MSSVLAKAPSSGKLAHIDSLRGVAILLVILVHCAQGYGLVGNAFDALARYGQMGVQLFFVLSAYTLCLSADKRGKEAHPLLKYGLRRFFRIAPMYYVGIALYAAVASVGWFAANPHTPTAESYSLGNVLANVSFLHGFYAPANNSIVPGGWSIGTEVAFYAVFPFLFAFAKTCFAETGAGRVVWVMMAVSFSQIVLLCGYPLGLEVHNGGFMYFNLLTQAPVFFVGMAYYFHETQREREYAVGYNLLAFTTLTAVALALWSVYLGHLYSVIAIVSAVSFVHLIEVFRKVPWLNVRALQQLGRVSYSVYLLHFVVVWGLQVSIGATLAGVLGGIGSIAATLAVATLISYASARVSELLIERPCGKLGRRIIARVDTWRTADAQVTVAPVAS